MPPALCDGKFLALPLHGIFYDNSKKYIPFFRPCQAVGISCRGRKPALRSVQSTGLQQRLFFQFFQRLGTVAAHCNVSGQQNGSGTKRKGNQHGGKHL